MIGESLRYCMAMHTAVEVRGLTRCQYCYWTADFFCLGLARWICELCHCKHSVSRERKKQD